LSAQIFYIRERTWAGFKRKASRVIIGRYNCLAKSSLQSKDYRTKPIVVNALKLPVVDQKSCIMLLDMAQLRVLRGRSSRRLR